MASRQDSLERLTITRQIVYVLVATSIILPFLIKGISLPFEAEPESETFYKQLDRLPAGSHVLMSFDYDPPSKAELYPMTVALLRHCFEKDVIPIVMTNWPSGLGLFEKACEDVAAEFADKGDKKVSGTDYVFLGYRPSMTDLILNMGVDIKGAFTTDYYKQPTAAMPALEGVKSLRDLDLAVALAAGNTVELWMAYGSDRFGFPLAAGTTAIGAPKLYPFLDSGQLVGLLGGLRGAADYEKLIERPDIATSGMVALSGAHILLILLILGANIWYVVGRITGKEGK